VNADLSVAPEIAQLAQRAPADFQTGTLTLGHLAGELAALAADPRQWWDQVRFDPDAPLTIPLSGGPLGDRPLSGGPTSGGPTSGGPTSGGPTSGGPLTIPLSGGPTSGGPIGDGDGDGVWLLVTPPLATVVCDCHLATLLAGEAAEGGAPLRHGRTRVHGRRQSHLVTGTAGGYAVSLHLAVRTKG
jgi:hypothetical protein